MSLPQSLFLEVDGLFLQEPEPGLIFKNLDKKWCFQRASELKYASPMHLFILRDICIKQGNVSQNFVSMIDAEGKRRNIDFNDPTGVFIKHGYLAQARGEM